jgi:hypothetical protein
MGHGIGRILGRSLVLLAIVAAFGTVQPARAADGEGDGASDCGWFPDIQCGRSGRWEGFHMPIVQFALFEDPFITTGLYPFFAYHEFPNSSALQGGNAYDVSVQARVAVTDRLAIIATKDGYVWNRPGNPLLNDTQGWLNLAGGVKYAILQNEEERYIVSGILRFEFPSGSSDTFQGWGDGQVIPSIAGAYGIGDLQLIGDLGFQIPFHGGQQSTSLFYHLYVDYNVAPFFAPFFQLSGITWIGSGNGKIPVKLKRGIVPGSQLPLNTVQTVLGTGPFEGADLFNLGSRDMGGRDLVTWALGFNIPIVEHVTFSAAYERPLSHHKGIFKQRVTSALVIEF